MALRQLSQRSPDCGGSQGTAAVVRASVCPCAQHVAFRVGVAAAAVAAVAAAAVVAAVAVAAVAHRCRLRSASSW